MANMNQVQLPSYDEVCAERLKKQSEYEKKLDSWISIPHEDVRKLIFLYPMLDASLFYDFLNKEGTIKFSQELSSMSQNMEIFSTEFMNFFKVGAEFFYNYSISSKTMIDNEDDLKFGNFVEEFFANHPDIFNSLSSGLARKN